MNSTVNDAGNQEGLSAEEREKLDGLEPGDGPAPSPEKGPLVWDVVAQEKALAALLTHKTLAKSILPDLKPGYFGPPHLKAGAEVLKEHWDKYKELPEEWQFQRQFENKAAKYDKADIRGLLKDVYKETPGEAAVPAIADELREFVLRQKFGKLMADLNADMKEHPGMFAANFTKYQIGLSELKFGPAVPAPLMRWDELVLAAEEQADDDIVDQILPGSSLVMLSGLPYAGKSTLISELMATTATEREFLGFKTRRVPILFVNSDLTREKTVVNRIKRGLHSPEEEAALADIFFFPQMSELPFPLTHEAVTAWVGEIREAALECGAEHGLIIIDTFRSAFLMDGEKGAECDSTAMTRVLAPLRHLARELRWTILLLHHNSRGSNQYAGSAAIKGNTDGMWDLSRDEGAVIAELKVEQREGRVPKITYRLTDTGLQVVSILDADGSGEAPKSKNAVDVAAICKHFSPDNTKGLTLKEALNLPCFVHDDERDVRRKLKECERAGQAPRLERTGKGGRFDPHRWFAVGGGCTVPGA